MRRTLLLLFLLGAPFISQAQSPADRAALATWDSTLHSVSDAAVLTALPRPALSARDLGVVAEVLRNGRLAALGKSRRYGGEVAPELEIVRRAHRDWPWAQYAAWRIEDAYLSGTGSTSTAWTQAMRLHRRPAVSALLAAIAADSGFVPALHELIRLAPYPLLWATPTEELRLARAAGRSPTFDAEVIARRVQLELEVGAPDSVDALLAKLGGVLPSPARYERLAAQVAFARNDREAGDSHYHRGIARILGLDDFDEFAADAEWIADSAEYSQLTSLPIGDASRWLEAFWNRRDLLAARLPGERLAEHFRRYRVALRDYRDGTGSNLLQGARSDRMEAFLADDAAPRQQPQGEAATTGDAGNGLKSIPLFSDQMMNLGPAQKSIRILDDRGIAFLRHGAPDKSVTYQTLNAGPGNPILRYESWAYASATRPMIIHFGQLNPANPGERIRTFPGGGDLMTPCGLDAGFCIAQSSGIRADRLADRGVRDVAAALSTDDHPLRYRKDLEVLAQSYGIPGRGVLAVVAIPADRLVPKGAVRDTLTEYTAHLRVMVGDSASGRIVGSLDTIRTWRVSRRLGGGEWLSTWLEVDAPAGNWDVAIVANDTANTTGGGTRIIGVPVAAFDGHTLRLGDLILGRENAGLQWSRRGEAVPLNPTGAWRRDEGATLVYEVDGLVPGRNYETRLEVWEVKADTKRPRTVLTFREQAGEATQLLRRDLSLREIGTGDFRLVLRIRDLVSRAEAIRSRRLVVKR